MPLPYEDVTLARSGSTLGLVDPAERRIYLPLGADVQAGDVVGLRGYTRRVVQMPDVWTDAGVVAEYEDAPTYLPDLGTLSRHFGPGGLDEATGEITAGTLTDLGDWPCKVEPAQSDGSNPEIGDQQVGIVPFVVTVPLELVDVRVGDLFKVTQSRDGRLLVRTLVVKAVRGSSTDLTRDLLAFDNQGG